MSRAALIIGRLWPEHELSADELAAFERAVKSCDPQAVEYALESYRVNCPRHFSRTPRDLASIKSECWATHKRLRGEAARSPETRSAQQMARDYLCGVPVDPERSSGLWEQAMAIATDYRSMARDRIVNIATTSEEQLAVLRDTIIRSDRVSRTLVDGAGVARGLADAPVYDHDTGRVSSLWLAVITAYWARGGELWS